MLKMKLLLGMAVMVSAFAAMATPALAEWESASSATSGVIKALKGGALTATFGGVTTTVKCQAGSIGAEWQIRSTGKILEEFKGPGQQLTKRGPHDQIVIKNWGSGKNGSETCVTEAGILKGAAEVAPCTLQIHQKAGELKEIPGDQVTECLVKTLGCEIKIPPVTRETKGENWQLLGTTLENIGANQDDKANIKGIKATAGGGSCLIPGTDTNASLTGFEWEQLSMKAV
jgi:hypothetical protein